MKEKVFKLSVDTSFKLIGIVSYMSTHQVNWMLNKVLDMCFHESGSVTVSNKKTAKKINFPIYVCESSANDLYVLYANKSEFSTLIKSNKKVDYILKYSGSINPEKFTSYLKQIRQTKNILTAFEIDISQLRKGELKLLA